MEIKEKQIGQHLLLANEVSEKIINEFEPYQQREFLDRINENVKHYYNSKIEHLEKDLHIAKESFSSYLDIDKPKQNY